MTDKLILDACCGSRMFWFDKENPLVLFADIRTERPQMEDGREFNITPDIEIDFRNMPFPDNSFKMVVFDPPHRTDLGNSWMRHQYGNLLPTWESDIKAGFDECMRVLKPDGTLIFKWNEKQIKISKILSIIKTNPLFGHTTTANGKTIWMCFMKKSK